MAGIGIIGAMIVGATSDPPPNNIPAGQKDIDKSLLNKGTKDLILNELKECCTEEQIDALFERQNVKDYKMRNTLLREAMECTIVPAGVSVDAQDELDHEELQRSYYVSEKDTFLLIRGFYRAQNG
ncbi:MAG: hypothetical protein ACRCVN_04395 [Spirochaetia bacterium]